MTLFNYALTWSQEYNLLYLVAALAATVTLYLNHKYAKLITMPMGKISKNDFIKLSGIMMAMLFCMVLTFVSILKMVEMKTASGNEYSQQSG